MKMFSIQKRKWLVLTLLVLFSFLLKISEILIDNIWGDGNGEMTNYHIHSIVTFIQFYFPFSGICYWAFYQKIIHIKNIVLSFFVMINFYLSIELIFFFSIQNSENTVDEYYSQAFLQDDEALGYKLIPNNNTIAIARNKNGILYDVSYGIDSLSRRIVPNVSYNQNKKYAVFFGCSFTFGQGVNENETLSFFLAKYDSSLNTYNYGNPGYGVQQMLKRLESDNFKNEIAGDSGMMLYIFMNEHIDRATGSFLTSSTFAGDFPHYVLKNDSLIQKQTFRKNNPVLSLIYAILQKSYLLQYFKIDFPLRLMKKKYSDNDYQLTAKIIEESFMNYEKKFHNNNFYMIIYPGMDNGIKKYLRKFQDHILDYSALVNYYADERYHIPFDYHPAALTNEIVIKQFIKDIFN